MAIRKPAAQHPPIDHGVLAGSIGYRLHLADLVNMQGIGRALAGTGVTAARFTALELIASNPGIKPASLATAMMVERSNLVGLVRFLSQQGWVRSVAGSNRREKSLEATEAGRNMLRELQRRLARHEAALSASLSAAEREMLSRLLERVAGSFAAAQPAPAPARPARVSPAAGPGL
ncbi:MAG: MarR family transcriptional regulator [Burkholderiaceae bacterium]